MKKDKVDTDQKKIKVVIWDLDNTLWNGTLLENDDVYVDDEIVNIIKTLDNRGILQSIASKNEYNLAMEKIEQFGLSEYFLYPQINWNPKSQSVETIVKSINVGKNTVAFIDDQSYEREEVAYTHPQVMVIDAVDLNQVLDMPEMNPRFITADSKIRRKMYQSDIERKSVEETYEGPKDEFLATLNMVLTIAEATEEDLKRAEELTARTHQLNTTGYTYSYDELDDFRKSDDHKLLIASLDDKYGTYGKIGVSLLETKSETWTIKLFLMSCRVMSRGVGTVLINHIRNEARESGVRLLAEFIPSDVNRMMYMTYKFSHFKEIETNGSLIILENDLREIQKFPTYLQEVIIKNSIPV